MAKSKRVYIAQTDTIYKSVSEAAKVLNVNAANLAKTLTGQRKSAGGYTALDASAYQKGGRWVTPNRRSLRSKAQKLGISSVISDPLFSERKELQKLLSDVNSNAIALRKAGVEFFAKAHQQAMKFTDDIGATVSGLYKTDMETLSKLNEAEIKKFSDAIKAQQKYETYSVAGAQKAARLRGENVGLTLDSIVKYSKIIPIYFNLLDTISDKDWKYEEIIDIVSDAVSTGASEDDILQILGRIQYSESQSKFIYDMIEYRNYDKKTRRNILSVLDAYEQNSSSDTYKSILATVTQLIGENADPDLINDFASSVALQSDETLKKNFMDWIGSTISHDVSDSREVADTLRNHLDFIKNM